MGARQYLQMISAGYFTNREGDRMRSAARRMQRVCSQLSGDGKANSKGCALVLDARHENLTAVQDDQCLNDSQPQAGAAAGAWSARELWRLRALSTR